MAAGGENARGNSLLQCNLDIAKCQFELQTRDVHSLQQTIPVLRRKTMIDARLAPYGALALRIALGLMFIAHAYLKLAVFTVPGFAGFLAKIDLPGFLAWPIILAELVGGLAILTGFYGRYVSLALLPVLLGALFVHAPNGWLFTAPNGGWEYPAFLAVAALAHVLTGDGALALRPAALPGRRQAALA
jgi:putative oxidoreductase